MSYRPEYDGQTHINIYSKGKTELGRLLSNFAHTPFEGLDGRFESVEGYWYWLLAEPGPEREVLRTLYGYQAKDVGRKLRHRTTETDTDFEFQKKIVYALLQKTEEHAHLRKLLGESTLPFAHYYVSERGGVIDPGRGEWLLHAWEEIRRYVKVAGGDICSHASLLTIG